MKINKENCIKATLISESPLTNLESWHRQKADQVITTPRELISYEITAKEEIQFVYDILLNTEYGLYFVEKAYAPSEVAEYIEDLYSDLPDKRVTRFIISDEPMEVNYVYYTDNDSILAVYEKLIDIVDSQIDLNDKFIYVVDVAHELFRVNGDCEEIKEKLMELMNEK